MPIDEEELAGGNASGLVVRVGDTVRKAWTPHTSRVHAYLSALRSGGVDVPQTRGADEHGRQVLEFVPGRLAIDALPLGVDALARVGRLVRDIHDASAGLEVDPTWDVLFPTADADLLCHNDLAPWNLVLGERWVFIDWDGAGPSTRGWDLAYAALTFSSLQAGESVNDAGTRLAALVNGYGANDELRAVLPSTMALRARAMYELLESSSISGLEPWARMFVEGHGVFWRTTAEYIETHRAKWEAALRR